MQLGQQPESWFAGAALLGDRCISSTPEQQSKLVEPGASGSQGSPPLQLELWACSWILRETDYEHIIYSKKGNMHINWKSM